MIIGIIGGGASGMAAALAASENPNAQVIVFERQARVGRKLLATGNGRCNLTNTFAVYGAYHGEDAAFADAALEAFDATATREWFRSLGLYTVEEPSGRVYPYSDQANSVVDVLRFAMERPNITVNTGTEVQKIRSCDGGFMIDDTTFCHKVIIACGGLAGQKLGGCMSGYKLLSKFGHRSTKLRPSLVQLKSNWGSLAALKGVRTNCCVDILKDGVLFARSEGELQFTDYGLSGPVIFEVSRDVCCGAGEWVANLDFLPHLSNAELTEELLRRTHTSLPVDELLTGILHNRLGRVLTKTAGIRKTMASELTETEITEIVYTVKGLEVVLTEPMNVADAQVTAGGVYTKDFDPNTMESKLVPGLYACGEVLDIDGNCGGYNLQWAWSSGRCAGLHAGKEAK